MKKICYLLLITVFLISYNTSLFASEPLTFFEKSQQYRVSKDTFMLAEANTKADKASTKEDTIKIEVEKKKLVWLAAGIIVGVILVGVMSSSMLTPGPHFHR